ncbi:ChbG/HpnK family deacetylase [Mesobaculum littorinae]|uniref:ChbG/HpnK family deacetylase n=1 Tax=Mesobaculum littorinae TaxID=2486419 RepID=A0A438ALQ4_9RHOB|nr:ChbG/HpnK family deacetylase [Mesobaculum littorinae]RVV99466.1 ChbG/HpnK family deacetylase [Mesobaculum littorinae]
MRLIVTADDAGLSRAVDRGIAAAARSGIVTQTTLMAAAAHPDLPAAVARVQAMGLPCGIHLQLTTGAPLSAQLARATGASLPDAATAAHLAPALVEAEWRAQIEAVLDAGLRPSHLDSHQGLHRLPHLRGIYLSLARDHALPVRGDDPAFAAEARRHGVRATPRVLSGWTGRRLGPAELLAELQAAAGEDELCELVTHPGHVDARLRTMSAWCDRREAELAVLTDPRLAEDLAARGIALTDYRTLAP